MKLAFESKIFKRFMIFKKKKYIAIEIDEKGKEKDDIEIKGVILKRRDNSKMQRDIYYNVVMMIFNKKGETEVLNYILDYLEKLYSFQTDTKDFIVTKSIKDITNYKTRALPEDPFKREKKLEETHCENEEQYAFKSLPAHIQLVEKLKNRGIPVEAGSRIGFVFLKHHNLAAKQYDKIEEYDYYREYADILRIDFLSYVWLLIQPIDQVLEITFPKNKKFMKLQHKYRLTKEKMMMELKFTISKTKLNIS